LTQGNNKHLTEKEIEKSFGSNLCRCTGYRPILEAFKSLAVDAQPSLLNKIKDIEDVDQNVCPKSGEKCSGSCKMKELNEWCLVDFKGDMNSSLPKKMKLADGRLWFTVDDVGAIFKTLDETSYDSYMLVAGNTAKGA
jgi:xanthine dehydrogenase/oxidase